MGRPAAAWYSPRIATIELVGGHGRAVANRQVRDREQTRYDVSEVLVAVDLELDAPADAVLGLEAERELRVLAGLGPRGTDPREAAAEPGQRRADRPRLALDQVDVLRVPRRRCQLQLVQRSPTPEREGGLEGLVPEDAA